MVSYGSITEEGKLTCISRRFISCCFFSISILYPLISRVKPVISCTRFDSERIFSATLFASSSLFFACKWYELSFPLEERYREANLFRRVSRLFLLSELCERAHQVSKQSLSTFLLFRPERSLTSTIGKSAHYITNSFRLTGDTHFAGGASTSGLVEALLSLLS